MEHTKHIIRAVLLLVLLGVGFVFVRHFAIPKSFGQAGHYRYDSLAEYAALPQLHGAPGACAACHEDQTELRAEGEAKHLTVSCEVCHAPLGVHVLENERVADMPINRSTALCLRCHQRLTARPKEFPQIDSPAHVTDKGAEFAADICLECHDAHNPSE